MRTMSAKEEKALAILRRLRDHGFIALFNGGCVRDRLLGIPIKDYDIATDARPRLCSVCSTTPSRSARSSASSW